MSSNQLDFTTRSEFAQLTEKSNIIYLYIALNLLLFVGMLVFNTIFKFKLVPLYQEPTSTTNNELSESKLNDIVI